MRNILSKLPKKAQKEMKPLVHQMFYAPNCEQGLRQGQELITRFKNNYTSAMECLEQDLRWCITYLKFPEPHWRAIRTTNMVERTFGEGRRRTKVIPRFPTESSELRLLYASLITASQNWHDVKMTPDIWWELEILRKEAFGEQSPIITK
jgi:transposase-like protein